MCSIVVMYLLCFDSIPLHDLDCYCLSVYFCCAALTVYHTFYVVFVMYKLYVFQPLVDESQMNWYLLFMYESFCCISGDLKSKPALYIPIL